MASKEMFLKHFVKHNKLLFGFILTMVPNHVDAEDILQETAVVLWDKFGTYEPGTNFYAWAKQIAKNKVYEYYKTKKRLVLTDLSFLETIQTTSEPVLDSLDERMAAVRACLNKLGKNENRLIQVRFQKGISLKEVAQDSHQSVHHVYRQMSRIFVLLRVCVQKTLLSWDV